MDRAKEYRVYCAGKIGRSDWRHTLFPELKSICQLKNWTDDQHSVEFDPTSVARRGPFLYAGPFFVSGADDQHGEGSHGVGDWNRRVVRLCEQWIDDSDVMFAWLDDQTAYGTVAEIGYAKAKGIPVWLFEPPEVSAQQRVDMWFARHLASTFEKAPTAVDAFQRFEGFFVDGTPIYARRPRAGFVYLIQADTGEYKIGKTKNLEGRLCSFGGAKQPFKWSMIHCIECENPDEAEGFFHTLFARRRVNGEWFVLSETEVSFIRSITNMQSGGAAQQEIAEVPYEL